jgi:hypothetical protein
MSGKALEGKAEIQRLRGLFEWTDVSRQVKSALIDDSRTKAIYNSLFLTTVLKNAESHGDVDFIIEEDILEASGITDETIAKVLNSTAHVRNGSVSSFEFKGHQIDFVRVPNGTSLLNSRVLGHGGAGHLLRFIGRPYSLRLLPEGLVYRLEDRGSFVGNVNITADFDSVSVILGVSRASVSGDFRYGFKSLEDAYSFVSNSYLFTLSAFGLNENLEYVGKEELLEYEPFSNFITWLKREAIARKQSPSLTQWPVEPVAVQKQMLKKHLEQVSGFSNRQKQVFDRYRINRLISHKYNGNVVMDVTGLEAGPELSKFMEAYKLSFGNRSKFEFFMMSSGSDTIQESIQVAYAKYKKDKLLEESSHLKPEALQKVTLGESAERSRILSAFGFTQPGPTRRLFENHPELLNKTTET